MSELKFNINVRIWKDKATKSYIVYSKKYDISGYGKTKNEAIKMFLFTIDQIIKYTKPKRIPQRIINRKTHARKK